MNTRIYLFMYLVFTNLPGKYEDIPLVEFMYLVFTHLPGEYEVIPLYVPCVYSFAW